MPRGIYNIRKSCTIIRSHQRRPILVFGKCSMKEDRSLTNQWTGATYALRQRAIQLGLTFSPKITRKAIEALIREAEASRVPSEEQIDLAQYFGVDITEGMTSGQLDLQLVPIVRDHAIQAMRANPALRASTVIMFEGLPHEITFIGGLNGRYVADLMPLNGAGLRHDGRRQVPIKDIANAKAIARDTALAMFRPRRQPALAH